MGKDVKQTIGDNLLWLKEQSGWSYGRIEDLSGVPSTTVERIAKAQNDSGAKYLPMLAKAWRLPGHLLLLPGMPGMVRKNPDGTFTPVNGTDYGKTSVGLTQNSLLHRPGVDETMPLARIPLVSFGKLRESLVGLEKITDTVLVPENVRAGPRAQAFTVEDSNEHLDLVRGDVALIDPDGAVEDNALLLVSKTVGGALELREYDDLGNGQYRLFTGLAGSQDWYSETHPNIEILAAVLCTVRLPKNKRK